VVALLYYVACRIDLWVEYGFQSPIIAAFFILMFLSAVRGTFAYHRLEARMRPEAIDLGSAPDVSKDFSIGTVI
jgi:hypothetical protein